MSRTFTLKGKRYRVNTAKAAAALIGITGIVSWVYLIALLEKAVLLGW